MSSIFGGSKSKQQSQQSSQSQSQSQSNSLSYNQAYPWAKETFGGMAQNAGGANDMVSALLGVGGDSQAAQQAFDNYKNSAGYQFQLQQGMNAINGNAAAKGMLSSGATAKALAGYGQNLASTYYNNYLDKLLGVGQQGLQAGGLVTGAGNVSQSNSTSTSTSSSRGTSSGNSSSKPGIGGFIGSIASALPSDRRLKLDIKEVGDNEGLTVYDYRYIWDEPDTVRRGYMADEVAKLHPEALGPELPGGYQTVRYDLLPAIKE